MVNEYNITSGKTVIDYLKKSKYYKMNLGKAISRVDQEGNRKIDLDKSDIFTKWYHDNTNHVLFSEGNLGKLSLFTDHYLSNDIYIFCKQEWFKYEFSFDEYINKGVDFYLASLIKDIENKNQEAIAKSEEIIDYANMANPNKVFSDPANVTYEDLVAYKKLKNKIQ